MPNIIYADSESLIKKTDGCANIPENYSTTKIGKHIPCGYLMSVIWAFDHIENKHNLYHRKDCMKKFCTSLREYAKNIIDFEKKKKIPLIKEEQRSHQDQKLCYVCRKRILKKLSNSINYGNVGDHCHYKGKYRSAAHSICNLKFNVPNEIPAVFHNGSNYDYRLTIKELANEFKGLL